MESRFGHDFARVRIHADTRAAESAVAVSALAYTVGNDVVFGAGQYTPRSAAGRRLLAHELAHIIRNDYLVSVFQSVVETVLFYHPAVWWVSRQVRREREYCCDELAVQVKIGTLSVYAEPLTVAGGVKYHGARPHPGPHGQPRIHNGHFTIRPHGHPRNP